MSLAVAPQTRVALIPGKLPDNNAEQVDQGKLVARLLEVATDTGMIVSVRKEALEHLGKISKIAEDFFEPLTKLALTGEIEVAEQSIKLLVQSPTPQENQRIIYSSLLLSSEPLRSLAMAESLSEAISKGKLTELLPEVLGVLERLIRAGSTIETASVAYTNLDLRALAAVRILGPKAVELCDTISEVVAGHYSKSKYIFDNPPAVQAGLLAIASMTGGGRAIAPVIEQLTVDRKWRNIYPNDFFEIARELKEEAATIVAKLLESDNASKQQDGWFTAQSLGSIAWPLTEKMVGHYLAVWQTFGSKYDKNPKVPVTQFGAFVKTIGSEYFSLRVMDDLSMVTAVLECIASGPKGLALILAEIPKQPLWSRRFLVQIISGALQGGTSIWAPAIDAMKRENPKKAATDLNLGSKLAHLLTDSLAEKNRSPAHEGFELSLIRAISLLGKEAGSEARDAIYPLTRHRTWVFRRAARKTLSALT